MATGPSTQYQVPNTASEARLRLIIVGPGRAGGSLAIAAGEAGHQIVGVLSRSPGQEYGPDLGWDEPLPEADVVLISVKDDAIGEVVGRLNGLTGAGGVVAHVSGYSPVSVLEPLVGDGVEIGGFHPLQTLPDPQRGAAALRGAFVAIGGSGTAAGRLRTLGESLGMTPFHLDDSVRPLYHAAAAATSNFVVAALGIASDLYQASGIDPEVGRPLAEQVVSNVFESGAADALTGPIVRGDVATVRGQVKAADDVSDEVGREFRLLAEATAIRAGREEDVDQWK